MADFWLLRLVSLAHATPLYLFTSLFFYYELLPVYIANSANIAKCTLTLFCSTFHSWYLSVSLLSLLLTVIVYHYQLCQLLLRRWNVFSYVSHTSMYCYLYSLLNITKEFLTKLALFAFI